MTAPAKSSSFVRLQDEPGIAGLGARPPRYLWTLFALLMSATIFEGYDITIFHLCTPDIARSFHLADRNIGLMASIVRVGGIMSIFVVASADRFGRKPVITATVLVYALFSLTTALSTGLVSFTIFQSCAQVFLAAEFGVAVTIIGEEFPEEKRGRAIAGMHMVAFLGVTAAGLLYGILAESRFGWRGMYMLGVAPMLLVAFLRRGLKETVRFELFRTGDGSTPVGRVSLREKFNTSLEAFRGPYRARLLLVAAMCNSVGVAGGPTITFFSLYARRDHHWSAGQVGQAIIMAYLVASLSTLLCGQLMDKVGRRAATSAFYLCTAGSMLLLFQARSDALILFAIIAMMFSYQGARTATATFATELFPTEIRATGFCLTVQVLGQLGWIIAPLVVGLLSVPLGGLGNAASIFAAGPVVGAVLAMFFAPETRNRTLEELSPPLAGCGPGTRLAL